MTAAFSIVAVLAMVAALGIVPFGLPGLWIMVGILLVGAVAGAVTWPTWMFATAVTGAAELGEYWLVGHFGDRYGGSRRAFWGALLGGFVGLFLGMPIPVIGSMVAAFVGSFVGAAAVTLLETRSATAATRVGWGVLLGRTGAVVLKVGVGSAVLALGTWAFLFS